MTGAARPGTWPSTSARPRSSGLRALGPVNDTIATVPMPALSHLHMEPEHSVPVAGDGLPLGGLPGKAIDALVAVAGAGTPPGLVLVEVRHLGGELARPRPGNGALAAIDEEYALYAVGALPETPVPGLIAPVMARIDAIRDALAPWTAPRMCLNFAETRHPAAPFWTEQAYRRLRQIKAAVDLGDLIRANHPLAATDLPICIFSRHPDNSANGDGREGRGAHPAQCADPRDGAQCEPSRYRGRAMLPASERALRLISAPPWSTASAVICRAVGE
jgi:hypothetical protein